jgi:hypothetical protein
MTRILPLLLLGVLACQVAAAPQEPTFKKLPVATAGPSCLSQSGPLVTLSGSQKKYDVRKSTVSNERFDASNATWSGIKGFPVEVGNGQASGVCWHGGSITSGFPPNASWSTYHSSAGLFMGGPNFTVEDATVTDYGDAIRWEDTTDNWTLRRFHVIRAHDDCVENDRLYGGLIDDSFFEGCYVFLSERAGGGVNIPVDGRPKTVTIQNTLVWLKPMPTVYKGPAPGTGPLWKWSSKGSHVTLTHVVFRVDQKPSHGDLKFPPLVCPCTADTLVWLGGGSYPEKVPSGVTVVTNVAVWDAAVADWKARHP